MAGSDACKTAPHVVHAKCRAARDVRKKGRQRCLCDGRASGAVPRILHPNVGQATLIKTAMQAIHQADLPYVGSSYEFVGAEHDGLGVSMFVVVAEAGRGPVLHRHRYDEVVYVIEGRSRWTVDGRELEAGPGDILVVRAGEKHKFAAVEPLRQIDIHLSPTFEQENLE